MEEFSREEEYFTSAVLETMLLISTLSTVVEVRTTFRERREGRDPSSQETYKEARARLLQDESDLQEMLIRLQAGLVYTQHAEEERHAALVRRFDTLLTLRRIDRILQSIHQRLLSLYPDVSEALVEEVRIVQKGLRNLGDTDENVIGPDPLSSFIDRSFSLLLWMRKEISR